MEQAGRRTARFAVHALLAALATVLAAAQTVAQTTVAAAPRSMMAEALPDSPGARTEALTQDAGGVRLAPVHQKYIRPDEQARTLTRRNKVVLGFDDLDTGPTVAAIFLETAWEQAVNGAPNYGTDRGAFGERLGASTLRQLSEGIFTDAVFAPMLHEDPRYYVEGGRHGVVHRTLYAVTRPLVTRTDSGGSSVNGAMLLGYAVSSVAAMGYYPPANRNVRDAASVFGGSLGGAALGFFLSEFTGDMERVLHLHRAH